MEPKVSIIILNWNGWEDTIECLESIYQINYTNYDIVIVDNNSTDNSLEKIKEYCEGKLRVDSNFFRYESNNKPIEIAVYTKEEAENLNTYKTTINKTTIIKNDKNYGFAEGNNVGIRFSQKNPFLEYVLLLNNDTVVDKDFLFEMVKIGETNPQIGVVGPKNFYYDYNGAKDVINFEGGKVNLFKGEVYHIHLNERINVPQIVDYVEGSCILLKNNVIENVGVLDPEYFLYWEETDLCIRIKKKGYSVLYVPKAKIWHKVETSMNKKHVYFMTRNRFLFMRKNANKKQILFFLVYFFAFKFWLRLIYYIISNQKLEIISKYLSGTKNGVIKLIRH